MAPDTAAQEQGLEAPTRHVLNWKDPQFTDPDALNAELERVFDICSGCRRCINLCNAFPTLFDLIDNSETFEIDGVAKEDYGKVVAECYICDLCFSTKCPYVPPHSWNLDFPHLMLRAKHAKFKSEKPSWNERLLSATDGIGKFYGIPIIAQTTNFVFGNKTLRRILEPVTQIHRDAPTPRIVPRPKHARAVHKELRPSKTGPVLLEDQTSEHHVLLFATCYINQNEPQILDDMIAILRHNNVSVHMAEQEACCGMPRMEFGNFEKVEKQKNKNIPHLKAAVDQGFDILAAIPSCVMMFRKEMPLLFPDDPDIKAVAKHVMGPFEYFKRLHDAGHLNTEFPHSLGKLVLHSSCHQRVQMVGHPVSDIFELVPDTNVTTIERCSGHDGTYAVKRDTYQKACKIGRPIARHIDTIKPDHYGSDCPLASQHIGHLSNLEIHSEHPLRLLRNAYGI